MTILVAGATGLAGSAIVRELTRIGRSVVGISSKDVDLLDRSKTFAFVSDLKPTVIIDCAAKVGGIGGNNSYPVEFLSQNLQIQTKMSMYKLIPTNDKSCYKYNNEYYILESLTEENRYKTTSILESIIGDLQNFILTSVLLQGANETFKNKDNKQKKEFLCKILNIDHYSTYEKEIVEEYKKIKKASNPKAYTQVVAEILNNEK